MPKIILDLCGGTGAWSRPYKEAGYEVHVITLPKLSVCHWFIQGENIHFPYQSNNLNGKSLIINTEDVYGVLAAPPCTMFSMARTNARTPRDLEGAMQTVYSCLKIIWRIQYNGKRLAFWAMENPKARLRWFMGLPAMTFSPQDFGDAYRKPTDLWGNFNTDLKKTPVVLNEKKRKQSQLNTQELLPIPSDYIPDPNMSKRAIARSITHPGFAQAFFNANR